MKMRFSCGVALVALMGLGAVVTAPQAAYAQSGEVRVKIRLSGAAISRVRPEGNAEYRTRPGRTGFKVEATRVNLPVGTVLGVKVNGVSIGSIRLALRAGAAFPGGQLELRSQDGATVPVIKAGDVVSVSDPAGAVVLSGSF